MYFPVVLVTALFFGGVPIVLCQNLQVNTPTSVVSCEPIQLAWSGGSPPYYLSFVPAGQTGAAPLIQFPPQNGNTYTWMTNLPAGTTFTITLRDGEGIQAFSDKVTVLAGPQASCDQTTSSISEAPGSSGSAPATVADANSSEPLGPTPSSSAQPTVPVIAKTTFNSNSQSTGSFVQPKATSTTKTQQHNASYKFSESRLQTVLTSIGTLAIVFLW